MPENEWISLALALWLIGTPDAATCLQRAWMAGDLLLRGVRSEIPETDAVVEIPASERGRLWLHCPSSQLRRGSRTRWLTAYHSVQVRKADIERLAPVSRLSWWDGDPKGCVAAAPAPQTEPQAEKPPQDQSASTAETLLPKQLRGRLVVAVAAVLYNEWPRRPGLGVEAMLTFVGTKFRSCSTSTVERAIRRLNALKRWSE